MKEYTFIILITAAMITIMAVSAAAIVCLRAKYGSESPVFQLSRIGILWAAAIVLLLLCGASFFAVTDWTSKTIMAVFTDVVLWAKANRLMASILLWSVSVLALLLFKHLEICTAALTIIIATLHVWATYIIWANPAWPTVKAVVFAIIIGCCADSFDVLERHSARIPAHADRETHDDEAIEQDTSAIGVLGGMIAECAETVIATVRD